MLDMSVFRNIRVAIVHDWLVTEGGAERVLERLLGLFPHADIYTLFDKLPPGEQSFLHGKKPFPTFLQKIPKIEDRYRKMLPLLPHAIESLDLSGYDLILSSHYCVAKGIKTAPRQLHISYCHSPMRYAWDLQEESLRDSGLSSGVKGIFARWLLHQLRNWDAQTANNVDLFIANSIFISDRIWRCYRRESRVIYPPVDVSMFALNPAPRENFYVCVGRLVPYKRIDRVVEAFARLPLSHLIVIGDGPERSRLSQIATSNVKFLGRTESSVLRDHVARARAMIFPSYEDFGITPLEAQATGTPVLGYGKGGSLETIVPTGGARAPTGIHFNEQSADAIYDAIKRFETFPEGTFTPQRCREHALGFGAERFDDEISQVVLEAYTAHIAYQNGRCDRPIH